MARPAGYAIPQLILLALLCRQLPAALIDVPRYCPAANSRKAA